MPSETIQVGSHRCVLDARPDRIDSRDRVYTPPLSTLPEQWPYPRDLQIALPHFRKYVLNQGDAGACTGFGLAAVHHFIQWRDALSALPRSESSLLGTDLEKIHLTPVSPHQLYHLARIYDEWPGEDYAGSSCRGAIKGMHKHGVCAESLWPDAVAPPGEGRKAWQIDAAKRPLGSYYRVDTMSIADLQGAIYEVGAVYASARVHPGWNLRKHDDQVPFIVRGEGFNPSRDFSGAHAFALIGYNRQGFIVQNSWGSRWGFHGFAILPYFDWADAAIDAWVIVRGAPTASMIEGSGVYLTDPDEERYGEGEFVADETDVDLAPKPDSIASVQGFRLVSLAQSAMEADRQVNSLIRYGQEPLGPLPNEQAYGVTIVMGNEGQVVPRLIGFDTISDVVKEIAYDLPLQWWRKVRSSFGGPLRILLFFQGGLCSERQSIHRIARLAPSYMANGVYPIFISWRTGFLDAMLGMLEDSLHRFIEQRPEQPSGAGWIGPRYGATEAKDRAIESACQNLLVRPIWTQMKQDTKASYFSAKGMTLTIAEIDRLANDCEDGVQLHMVGHSAGAFLAGEALRRFGELSLVTSSCRLMAPACTVDFANRFFGPALKQGVVDPQAFYVHVLSDQLESADSVGPYGKSLLYLASRALETNHKEPIFGMQGTWLFPEVPAINENWYIPKDERNAVGAINPDIRKWRENYDNLIPQENIFRHTDQYVSSSQDSNLQIQQTHGSFDNNSQLLKQSIEDMIEQPLIRPLLDWEKFS